MVRKSLIPLALIALLDASLRASAAEPATAGRENDERTPRLQEYLGRTFANRVERVTVDRTEIRIEGRLADANGDLQLAEIGMWRDVTALEGVESVAPFERAADGVFRAVVPRVAGDGRDRLLSGWAFVRRVDERYEPASAMRYADHVEPRAELPPARPTSKKGLCGCPMTHADAVDLGVSSITLNVLLNAIVHAEPATGRTPFPHGGRTWYADDRAVARYDRELRAAADRGVMVSAIVLIAPPRDAAPGSWGRDVAHPDAEPSGMYVMPNFTSPAGVAAYAAAMDFLAERYSRPSGEFGRIHHWILHNEVNSGFHWTNAGRKSALAYLELYQKSMRVAHLTARQYDPNAKALISLDHWWTRNPDPRGYAARDLLDHLLAFGRVEGDFEWGLAFHPYAEDLGNPRTWNDPSVTFAFTTPLITFRNIEVLDAWARQPHVAYLGTASREIQLSEQGLNARDYSEKSLADQAAGLAYAWAKIEPLRTVTAFQYHRWADARDEGGLRLGLRKFGDAPGDPFGQKPVWHVFRAMGTEDWEPATAFAKPIVGVKDWKDVRHTGEIK